jgi:YggT family protein
MGWNFLLLTIQLLQVLILASVVASWLAPMSRHPALEALRRASEAVLGPIRSVLPSAGGLDFSPMVTLVLLSLLRNFILRSMPY